MRTPTTKGKSLLRKVLEGTFRAFRWYKAKKQLSDGKPLTKKQKLQLEEDEKVLSETPLEELNLKKYKPIDKKLGNEFKINFDLPKMSHLQRTMFILSQFQVKLTEEEFIALVSLDEREAKNTLGALLLHARDMLED